ncbi:MAG: mechanosensitive ion channel family protein [Sulfolobales archaeon]|nr:mechanosensitive ion channel family protein [Sulfolobales archaeon]MCX8186277.1 mechanosensitive ion channel family protein [Sulfolobales archaeon]MDW7968987.1 mechanosensitive ion channel family protein [Sulfolobales archaeon]
MSSNTDKIEIALQKLILYVALAAVVMGVLNWVFNYLLVDIAKTTGFSGLLVLTDYWPYVSILVSLVLGWFIVSALASMFYAILKPKYGPSAASAIRSLIRILGLGGLFAAIAGGVAGGTAGVALGGFIGLVVGFATQQVLGQAVSGMFLLLARPFKIGDVIDAAGESEVRVLDIGTLFTIAERKDGNKVLIPSTALVGQKIVIRKES